MKMREPHVLPLSLQTLELLRSMQAITGHRHHIFAHRDNRDQAMTEGPLRQALKQLGWAGRYSPHATRATGSTLLNEMGCNRDWIERQLAHRDKAGARSSYNQATDLKDRAIMMQTWADTLDPLEEQYRASPNEKKRL
jgi:integrase